MEKNKKKYIKPAMQVYKIEPTQLLNASVDETKVNFGGGYPED